MNMNTDMRQQKQDKTSSPLKWFLGAEFALLAAGIVIGVLGYWAIRG